MMRNKFIGLVGLLVILSLALGACGAPATTTDAGAPQAVEEATQAPAEEAAAPVQEAAAPADANTCLLYTSRCV